MSSSFIEQGAAQIKDVNQTNNTMMGSSFDHSLKPSSSNEKVKTKVFSAPKVWTQDEDIALFKAVKSQHENDATDTRRLFFEEVSKKLAVRGVARTGASCGNRWEVLECQGQYEDHFLYDEIKPFLDHVKAQYEKEVVSQEVPSTSASVKSSNEAVRWSEDESKLLYEIVSTHKTALSHGAHEQTDASLNWANITEEHNAAGHNRTVAALKSKWHKRVNDGVATSVVVSDNLIGARRKEVLSTKRSRHSTESVPAAVDANDVSSVPKKKTRRSDTHLRQHVVFTDPNDDERVVQYRGDNLGESRAASRGSSEETIRIVSKAIIPGPAPQELSFLEEKLQQTKKDIATQELQLKIKDEAVRRHDFDLDIFKANIKALEEEAEQMQLQRDQKARESAQTSASLKVLKDDQASYEETLRRLQQ